MEAFGGGAKYLADSSVERRLRYIVELRVSQINGCAYCIDLHSKQLRKEGETDRRIDCLSVWDEVQQDRDHLDALRDTIARAQQRIEAGDHDAATVLADATERLTLAGGFNEEEVVGEPDDGARSRAVQRILEELVDYPPGVLEGDRAFRPKPHECFAPGSVARPTSRGGIAHRPRRAPR